MKARTRPTRPPIGPIESYTVCVLPPTLGSIETNACPVTTQNYTRPSCNLGRFILVHVNSHRDADLVSCRYITSNENTVTQSQSSGRRATVYNLLSFPSLPHTAFYLSRVILYRALLPRISALTGVIMIWIH